MRLFLRVVDRGEKLGRALHEQERGLVVDVGDEQGGEEEAVAGAGGFEGGEEGVLLFGEVGEGEFFDLGDGEAVAGFSVGFAVGVDGLLGGEGEEGGADGEDLFGELGGSRSRRFWRGGGGCRSRWGWWWGR